MPCEGWEPEAVAEELRQAAVLRDVPWRAVLPEGLTVGGVRERAAVIRARLGVGLERRVRVRARRGPQDSCEVIVSGWQRAEPELAGAVHIALSGLRPGTFYQATLIAEGPSTGVEGEALGAPAWFWTAPSGDEPVRLAFAADVSAEPSRHGLLPALIAARPHLYLSLGDWPYADIPERSVTLAQFRQRHAASREAPGVLAWTRSMGIHAVWDDHEVHNDWDARAVPRVVAAARRAWREVFPVVGAPEGEIYRRYRWGQHVEIFHLDTRSHRGFNASLDQGQKTMLGSEQLRWLLDGLSQSEAPFKLVVTTVPLGHGTTGDDQWTGYPTERRALLSHVVERRIGGVIFLTADQHWLSVHHLPEGFKMFQTGPLAQFLRRPSSNVPPWVLLQKRELNFGLIDVSPGVEPGDAPVLTFSAIGEEGVLYREEVAPGVAQLHVDVPAGRGWRLSGAHQFFGRGPEHLRWVTPGQYALHIGDRVVQRFEVVDGAALSVSPASVSPLAPAQDEPGAR